MKPRHVSTFALACGAAFTVLALAARDRLELTRARRQAQEADRRALTDPLTGLANRAGLHTAWPTLAPTAPVLALIDLDGFKPVNDQYGHAAGDTVLATIAGRLRTLLPDLCIARLGGDEFVVVLPGPMHQAHTLAVHVAATIALSVPVAHPVVVTVTASIGLASAFDADLGRVLAAADAAMYRAKTSRTGIAVHDPQLDDRTSLLADPRPAVRLRTLHAHHEDLMEVSR